MTVIQKTALTGIMAAAQFAVVAVFGLLPGLGFLGAMAAGFLLIFLRDTAGRAPAYIAYGIAAVLLLLLSAKKLPAAAYAALFGYYPVLFADLAGIKSLPLRALLKALVFEGVAAAAFFAVKFFVGFESFGVLRAAAERGISQKTVLIALVALYHVGFLAYEGFLWVYYKLFNDKIAARLRSVVRPR